MIELVTTNLFWRNTKDSVKDEYNIPPLVEDLVLLDFTGTDTVQRRKILTSFVDTEMISYSHSNESGKYTLIFRWINVYIAQRQLCCSHGFGSLSEYRQTFISSQKVSFIKLCS